MQIDRIIPVGKLKYYFAVDTVYVGKKLGLLLFPYMHQVRADSGMALGSQPDDKEPLEGMQKGRAKGRVYLRTT